MAAFVSGALPPVVQGTVFSIQIGPDVPPADYTAKPLTLYLDPPESAPPGTVRITLTQAVDGVVSGGGSTVTFTKPPSWTAALAPGSWDLWVAEGDATTRDELLYFTLPVVAPRNGPLS